MASFRLKCWPNHKSEDFDEKHAFLHCSEFDLTQREA